LDRQDHNAESQGRFHLGGGNDGPDAKRTPVTRE